MKDLGDKVSSSDKTACEDAIKELKAVIDGDDVGAIKSKTETLKQASYKIAEQLYKQQSATTNEAEPSGKADDVEYEVHNEKAS